MSLPLSDPDMFNSLVSTGWKLATGDQNSEVPRALVGAGKFVLKNWSPLAAAGEALVGRGRTGKDRGGIGSASAMALSAVSLGLTASVAKMGLSLLQRRLQARDSAKVGKTKEDKKKDPLRGLNQRSKTLKKTPRDPTRSSRPPSPPCHTQAPLQQLKTLFPDLNRSLLGDMLASNQGSLEVTIDQLLSLTVDSAKATPAGNPNKDAFKFPPSSSTALVHPSFSSSSPLPPCPECPVCFSSLAGKRIFQCASGHHVCKECKDNPQLKVCPTCRQKLIGRATNMEQFLATLYGKH
eukprot:GFUD01039459.1.p1 GENE.GFUD01039459.1~~GFUD01039459.1.p1  ORF type:complete len:294 (-),score=69.85 GFUD01039459.1:36-917(-)